MDAPTLAGRIGDVQVVDVRYPNEWEAGRIEAAVPIPADDLWERLDELDRDRLVVTVCKTGARSANAAAYLMEEGFTAESLDGGLDEWVAAGLPLTAEGGGAGEVVDPEAPEDDRPPETQQLQAVFLETLFAVDEHFGGREASDDEIREFLRQRLIGEGRSPEEADRFLEDMGP